MIRITRMSSLFLATSSQVKKYWNLNVSTTWDIIWPSVLLTLHAVMLKQSFDFPTIYD